MTKFLKLFEITGNLKLFYNIDKLIRASFKYPKVSLGLNAIFTSKKPFVFNNIRWISD